MATKTRALVRFYERSYQALFEDVRVYIQGVDVTPWIRDNVVIGRTDCDGPGTCTFTLDNALDRFVLTSENLTRTFDNPFGKWRDTTDRYSESAKHQIYLYKTGQAAVTVDRIAELTKVLIERNLDIVKAETETARRRLMTDATSRKRRTKREDQQRIRDKERNTITADQELRNAVSDAVQDMPADIVLEDAKRSAAEAAIFDELTTRGLSESEARQAAQSALKKRKDELVRAGRRRPAADGPAKETNADNSSPERSGRHKKERNIRNPVDLDTGDARWPLQDRSVIFHKNDPVRVFLHNPLTEDDFWLYGFAGFVDTYPVQTDYVTGQSSIQISCYDIRALMQKMRVQQNTIMPTRRPEPLFTDRTSIFADLISPNGDRLNHIFANFSFDQAMAILLTGTTLDRRGQGQRFGVGDLRIGKVVTYPVTDEPSDQNRATLEEWHTLCLNGPSAIADQNSIANLTPLTESSIDAIGRGTTSDGEYSPIRQYVHFLLPKDGTAAYNLVQQTFDAGSEQRDFVTRYDIISDFCAQLDYEFTVLPNGDLVFEFPMYDFLPEDFGDWQPVFEFNHHLISGNFADESGDVISAIVVTGGPERTEVDQFAQAPSIVVPRAIIQSSVIAARVGLTIETATLPFCYDATRLRSLGFVEFQKRLANASQLDFEFGFRPFLLPNRPVYNRVEQRMGLISSVTDTMQLFGTCSTATTLRFVRQVRADGTFRFITGGDSMPISYRRIFPGNVKSVGNAKAGVRAYPEFDGDDSALDNAKTTAAEAVPAPTTNDGRPPSFIGEARPGTFFALTPRTRQIAERIAASADHDSSRQFLLTNIPEADGTSFSIRARDPSDLSRLYTDDERLTLARQAEREDYILIDTRERFVFEQRRPGQPTFIVRPERG